MRGCKTIFSIAFTILFSFAIAAISSDVPQMINYQGRLTDSGGAALDTTVSITFTIYDASTSGTSKWTETQSSVTVTGGLFNVLLGSVNSISDTVFNTDTRYLGLTVGSDPEISPRTRLVSVGYAMQAQKADTAEYAINASGVGGWTDNGTTVNLTTDTDLLVVGPTTPSAAALKFDLRGHGGASSPFQRFYFNTTMPADLLYSALEIYSPAYSYTPLKILGSGTIIQNVPSKGADETVANQIDPDPSNYTFFNAGNVGIGTSAPSAPLEVGDHMKVSGSNALLHLGNSEDVSESYATFQLEASSPGEAMVKFVNGAQEFQLTQDDSDYRLKFMPGGVERVTVTAAGNLGIGVENPIDKIEIGGVAGVDGITFPDGTKLTSASGLGQPDEPLQGSTIIDTDTQRLINEWIGKPSQQWTQCYKMSVDGASSASFHSQCDNKGPTLTLIFANGRILGGYTETSWNQSVSGFQNCQSSFIFSISGNKVFPLAGGYDANAIFSSSTTGPVFGNGDIYIDLNSAQVRSSAPVSYSDGGAHGSPNVATTMQLLGTGINSFVPVNEVEVYVMDRPY